LSQEQRAALGLTPQSVNAQIKTSSSKWFRQLLNYDPSPVLKQLKCPVLAINGEKDVQVSAKENLAGIREALAQSGSQDVTIMALPGLNHLFQTCKTGSVSEYGDIEETFSPAALKIVSDWIRKRTGL
jgi:fermentation-respiration switch protein FrsA (DUF1100 family)